MLFIVLAAMAATALADCGSASLEPKDMSSRICQLEMSVVALSRAMQEVMTRTDTVYPEESEQTPLLEKRKNEFIRFGKRSDSNEKRKNEFIRFGKRKNEFIRFGRSDPLLAEDSMEKRKNEFIRFG